MLRAGLFRLAFILTTGISVAGCASYNRFADYTFGKEDFGNNNLMYHRSPAVSTAARTGGIVGLAGSWLVGGVWSHFTTSSASGAKNPNMNFALAPVVFGVAVGQNALGAPAWLAFGWWWPNKPGFSAAPWTAKQVEKYFASLELPSDYQEFARRPLIVERTLKHEEISQVGAIALSPDERICAIGLGRKLLIFDILTGECLISLSGHAGVVVNAKFSEDGKQIVSSSFDHFGDRSIPGEDKIKKDFTSRLWNIEDGMCVRIFEGHGNSIVGLDYASEFRLLVTGSDDGTAKVWDIDSGECLHTLDNNGGAVGSVAISPDGKTILTGSKDGAGRLWDVRTGFLKLELGRHEQPVWTVGFSTDGERVATGSPDGKAMVWSTGTGLLLFTLDSKKYGKTHSKSLMDDWFGPLPPRDSVIKVDFSADGKRIMTCLSSGATVVWDAGNGKRIGLIDSSIHPLSTPSGQAAICRVAEFSQGGRFILTGALDGKVRVWNGVNGKRLQKLPISDSGR